ncbi:MAG: transcriptional repressor [Acidobacteriia bacterium]|nr:transcriptional repressor [Terriglobia bacterium]
MSKTIPFEEFQSLCRRAGFIATHQRYLIFQTIVSLGDNPTPEEVFERVRRSLPGISLATVYKNIDTFVDHRIIRDISPNYGSRRIESASTPHDHFVCRVCRRVFDLEKHTELARPANTDLPHGASFEYHLVEFVGLCRSCSHASRFRDKAARPMAHN